MFPAITVLLRFFLSGCRQPWSGPDSIGLSDSLSRLQGDVSNRSQSSKWWRQRDTVVSKEHEQVCIISLCARDLRGNKTKWVGQILLLSCLFLKVICMLIVCLFVCLHLQWVGNASYELGFKMDFSLHCASFTAHNKTAAVKKEHPN